jgi:hypothetical protein
MLHHREGGGGEKGKKRNVFFMDAQGSHANHLCECIMLLSGSFTVGCPV